MDDLNTGVLNSNEFRSWLRSKHPDYVVGYKGEFNSCPIATYLVETHNVDPGRVNVSGSAVIANDTYLSVPVWVEYFIDVVDGLYDENADPEPVTALEAINALDDVEHTIAEHSEWFNWDDEDEEDDLD